MMMVLYNVCVCTLYTDVSKCYGFEVRCSSGKNENEKIVKNNL